MQQFHLPTWEELPDLALYMDQVVAPGGAVCEPAAPLRAKRATLTASAVNNYVRVKLIPPPVKKRYSRVHLAYSL